MTPERRNKIKSDSIQNYNILCVLEYLHSPSMVSLQIKMLLKIVSKNLI